MGDLKFVLPVRRGRRRAAPLPGCTRQTVCRCLEEERHCGSCPPLPAGGLLAWLAGTGYYRRTAGMGRYNHHKHRKLTPAEIEAQMMRRLEKQPNGCWVWRGQLRKGAPSLTLYRMGTVQVGRWLYKHARNRWDLAKQIHLGRTCGNGRCVNPDHAVETRGRAKNATVDHRQYTPSAAGCCGPRRGGRVARSLGAPATVGGCGSGNGTGSGGGADLPGREMNE